MRTRILTNLQFDLLEAMPLGEWIDPDEIGRIVALDRKARGKVKKVYGPTAQTWTTLKDMGLIESRWLNEPLLTNPTAFWVGFGRSQVRRIMKFPAEK